MVVQRACNQSHQVRDSCQQAFTARKISPAGVVVACMVVLLMATTTPAGSDGRGVGPIQAVGRSCAKCYCPGAMGSVMKLQCSRTERTFQGRRRWLLLPRRDWRDEPNRRWFAHHRSCARKRRQETHQGALADWQTTGEFTCPRRFLNDAARGSRFGLRPTRLPPQSSSTSAPKEAEDRYTYPQSAALSSAPVPGQISVSRVGQFWISANNAKRFDAR